MTPADRQKSPAAARKVPAAAGSATYTGFTRTRRYNGKSRLPLSAPSLLLSFLSPSFSSLSVPSSSLLLGCFFLLGVAPLVVVHSRGSNSGRGERESEGEREEATDTQADPTWSRTPPYKNPSRHPGGPRSTVDLAEVAGPPPTCTRGSGPVI